MKPEGYPLPWCEIFDASYWQVNLFLCGHRVGWREYQAQKDMRTIIPMIDRLIAAVGDLGKVDQLSAMTCQSF